MAPVAPPPKTLFGSRIARRIWLGYAIPLIVLIVAGVLTPLLLAPLLGQVSEQQRQSTQFVENTRRMAEATESMRTHLRSALLSPETRGHELREYNAALRIYIENRTDTRNYGQIRPELRSRIEAADTQFRAWRRRFADPLLLADSPRNSSSSAPPDSNTVTATATARRRILRGEDDFAPVSAALSSLQSAAQKIQSQTMRRSLLVEGVRLGITLLAPAIALGFALLIGRTITLGVVRPLENLRADIETLESAGASAHLTGADTAPDDEIRDIHQAFLRMAAAVKRREAMMRAQNDALTAVSRRLTAVLEATNEGILLIGRRGGYLVVNRRFGELFQVSPETLLAETFIAESEPWTTRLKNSPVIAERFARLLENPEAVTDEMLEMLPPARRVLQVYSAPVVGAPGAGEPTETSGTLVGRIFVFRDVTRETEADRMKTEFLSVVSHELKTPLTAIKGYVDLIVRGRTGPINDTQREFLQTVQTSTARLTEMINDLLDISRIDSGGLRVRRDAVDVGALVRESITQLQREADTHQITLENSLPDTLPLVRADAARVIQVLLNLLSNGIKYTPRGGTVTVSAEVSTGILTVCVADTGIGVSDEEQKHLFQRFFRADNSTTRSRGGTGLGLAITKTLVEKMSGAIWIDSAPGEGSRFFFTLPRAGPEPAGNPPPEREA